MQRLRVLSKDFAGEIRTILEESGYEILHDSLAEQGGKIRALMRSRVPAILGSLAPALAYLGIGSHVRVEIELKGSLKEGDTATYANLQAWPQREINEAAEMTLGAGVVEATSADRARARRQLVRLSQALKDSGAVDWPA